MQEICNQLEYGVGIDDIDLDYDPFSDQIENLDHSYRLIGHAYMYLETAYYLAPIEDDMMAIINDQGGIKGTLNVSLSLLSDNLVLDEYENLKDLLGKELNISIKINQALQIPENFSTNVFCQYTMAGCNNETFKTEMVSYTTSPEFNYSKTHKVQITTDLSDEFLNRALIISVYGDITKERKEKELQKIQEIVNKSITINPGIKLRELGFTEEELLNDVSFDNVVVVQESFPRSLDLNDPNVSALKSELSVKEREIKKIEEDLSKMEKEFDKQIQKRLKKIEKQEKIQPSNPEKKSRACMVF